MNNNEELISLLKRLHEKLHQIEEDDKCGSVVNLPTSLSTQKAMALWRQAQAAGYIDENLQPTISRTLSAVLANRIATILQIRNKWKIFGAFWNRRNMRSDYNKALTQRQFYAFLDELNETVGA
jgi:hypothetical protein